MTFWIILILVLLFCYFYAGMCVYIVGKPSGRNTEFGERLVMFGLSLFFWPFIPILALIAHD